MIRICNSLSEEYEVSLWGRKKSASGTVDRNFKQRRFSFIINKGPLFYLLYNVRVFFALLFSQFDIVHAVDLDTLPAGYFACKLKGKKLVYDSHEYFTEVPELISRPKKRNMWLKIERALLPNVQHAITVGQHIAAAYKDKYGVNFKVVRNCPALVEMPKPSEHEKYILYQGALNAGRGLEALIEAMASLRIKLKIAGSGDLDEKLKELTHKYNVTDKVEFLGMLRPSELPPLTVNAFAGFNVSENLGLSYYYSLNNKYFDYIHAEIPAITNPFPEYQMLNKKNNCCVFATAKSEEIVNAVNLLLDDKELYSSLKKNCLLARQKLNWGIEEKELLNLYEDIAK